jgi:hypothetical protein
MRGGFRAWLTPKRVGGKWTLVVPEYGKRWYSEEQYEKRFVLIQRIINERFKSPKLSPEARFRAGINAISYSLVKRVNIIDDGHKKWVNRGRPAHLSEDVLHDLGTVNTDRRISFGVREIFGSRLTDEEKDLILEEYVFDITGGGMYVNLKKLFHGFKKDSLSHSPADPIHTRWAMGIDEKPLSENEIVGKLIIPDNFFPPTGSFNNVDNFKEMTDEVVLLNYNPSKNNSNSEDWRKISNNGREKTRCDNEEYVIGDDVKFVTSINKNKSIDNDVTKEKIKKNKKPRVKREKVEEFFIRK